MYPMANDEATTPSPPGGAQRLPTSAMPAMMRAGTGTDQEQKKWP